MRNTESSDWPSASCSAHPVNDFGHRIHVGDVASDIGGDDGITNAAERHPQHFATLGGTQLRATHRLAEQDDEGAR
jgi:hypothetical protein